MSNHLPVLQCSMQTLRKPSHSHEGRRQGKHQKDQTSQQSGQQLRDISWKFKKYVIIKGTENMH